MSLGGSSPPVRTTFNPCLVVKSMDTSNAGKATVDGHPTFNRMIRVGSTPTACTKFCGKCRQTKPLSDFNKKGKRKNGSAILQPWCRECNRIRSRQYYADNREEHKAETVRRKKLQRKVLQNYIVEFLRKHPCVDCTEPDIVVLEFDHVRGKKANIAHLVSAGYALSTLQREMDKCEVVCANCHRRRTYKRAPTYKSLAL